MHLAYYIKKKKSYTCFLFFETRYIQVKKILASLFRIYLKCPSPNRETRKLRNLVIQSSQNTGGKARLKKGEYLAILYVTLIAK